MDIFANIPLRYLSITAHVLLWLAFSAFVFFFLESIFPFEVALRRTLLNLFFLVVLFYLNAKWLINTFFEQGRYWAYLGLAILLVVVTYSVRKYLFNYMATFDSPIILTLQVDEHKQVYTNSSGPGGFAVFILLSSVSQILENRLYGEVEAQKKLKEEANVKLQYLRSQINPHLLFNMLNNIYSLSVSKSPKAPETILYLSEILRYSLYTTEEGQAFLDDEITQIKRYIALMQMNNASFANVKFKIHGETKGKKIPPMLLLPLVENCFKHSNAAFDEAGDISISLDVASFMLHFTTDNSKVLSAQKRECERTEMGMTNIQKRMEIMGKDHSFKHADTGDRFRVELKIRLA